MRRYQVIPGWEAKGGHIQKKPWIVSVLMYILGNIAG
jgi:hypothetical protein